VKRPAIAIGSALVVLSAAGCASSQKPQANLPSGLEVFESEPAERILVAGDLLTVGAPTTTFTHLVGDDTIAARHAWTATEQLGARWVYAIGDERTQYLTENDSGDIVMTAAVDHPEKALTLFDPPLLMAPRSMAPGDRRESTSSMRVVDVRDQRKRREHGTCTRTIEYTERQRIRTPLGEFVAPRVDVTFHADLALADVKQTEHTWVMPGHGMIARQRTEDLRILGMVGKTTERTALRME
jgi:hypothetical protein